MNALDWCLVVVAVAYAISGYWQGFIAGAAATLGLILGGVAGVWAAPKVLGEVEQSIMVSVGALMIVLVLATLGQAVFQTLGAKLRNKMTWRPVRALDAVGGAALSVVAVLLVAWVLGVAISGSRLPGVGPQVRSSVVLGQINRVMPGGAHSLLSGFDAVVGQTFFPRYLEPFAPERIVAVGPGPKKVLQDPDVQAAEDSVFKIKGQNQCGAGVEGSGFLYAPGRLMTNAHVVAGVDRPQVIVDQRAVEASVVYYNPDVDVAVLGVPGLLEPSIGFDTGGEAKQAAAVLGFPQDGPFDAQPVRIRAEQRLRSPNIYGDGSVTREVFSMRGLIRPGNSGGPVVSRQGKVLGVVFAASISDADTGYALTADQVAQAAALGISNTTQVSTGGCSG